jgi:hypothetical protein
MHYQLQEVKVLENHESPLRRAESAQPSQCIAAPVGCVSLCGVARDREARLRQHHDSSPLTRHLQATALFFRTLFEVRDVLKYRET